MICNGVFYIKTIFLGHESRIILSTRKGFISTHKIVYCPHPCVHKHTILLSIRFFFLSFFFFQSHLVYDNVVIKILSVSYTTAR